MDQIKDLKALEAEMEKDSMKGLWVREEELRVEPKPFGAPKLWKWTKVRAALEAAARLVPTNYKGARRAVQLVHPSLGTGTSHTLGFAVQLVKAGESVYSHRHTAAAMRFVLHGGEGVYTITNGEKCVMERGDLVIQPNWGWHNHINETAEDAVWIDCLDAGLMRLLHAMFQEPHPSEEVRLYNSPVDNAVRYPAALAPLGKRAGRLVYKWRETLPALTEMLPEDRSPFDGRCMEYLNPATGGPTFPTFSCWIQMLRKGEETGTHRHTANHLCYAFQGSGRTEADGGELLWEEGDFFVIPNWTWHRHSSGGAQPSILFSTTDRPLFEALGVYREESH